TGDTFYLSLAAELPFGTHFASHAGNFRCEGRKLIDHRIDGVLELEYLAPDIDRNFLGQVAPGNGCRNLRDIANLSREVRRHQSVVIGHTLPRAAYPFHQCLAAELSFGTDFARHARDLGSK